MKYLSRLLDFAAFGIVRAIIALMEHLPRPVAYRIACGCVLLVRVIIPRTTKAARRNLELVFPEKSEAEREELLKRSQHCLAANLLSFARVPLLTAEKAENLVVNVDEYRAVLDRARLEAPGTGILVPAMHFGPMEEVIQLHALIYRPIAVLARGFGLKRLDAWWARRREMFGNEMFSRTGGYSEIERRLNKGQDVALLFDQNVKINHAMFVDLFGIKAATTKSIALAALRTGAPIVFSVGAQLPDGKVKAIFEQIPNPKNEPGEREEKMLRLMESIHRCVERAIREYPEQWFWIHRRFKTRPPGEAETMYD